jgi:ribosomal protein L29
MAKKKLKKGDLTSGSTKELIDQRNELKKELFEYMLKNSIRALKQTHLIRAVKKNIARINTAFEHFPEFKRMKQKIAFNFAIKGLLFNFITSLGDPISSVPYLNLIKHIFAHGLELHDESKFIRKRFKNMIRLHPGKQAYLMGHVHLTHHNIHPTENRSQIVTDTWRQEFNIKNGKPIPKSKTESGQLSDKIHY